MTLGPSTLGSAWPRSSLGEAVEFLDHIRKPITAIDRESGPYPYYGANGQQDSVAGWLFDEPLILLAEDGGHFDEPSKGVAYAVTGKCWVNNHAHVLRPRAGFDFGFLRWHLAHYDMSTFVNGTTRGKLTKAAAERVPLLRPPLPEQRRIAGILDKADAVRRKRREAIALTEDLLRSTFLDMFGDPLTNPKGWPLLPLGQLLAPGESINYGVVQPGGEVPDGVPLVRVGDFDGMVIDTTSLKRIGREIESAYARSRLCGDEVLLACVGSIGKVALASHDLAGANIARAVARIRPGPRLERTYLAHFLLTPFAQQHFSVETRTVSQPTLNIKQIQETPTVVPPRKLQDEFRSFEGAVRKLSTELRAGLSGLEDLFGSLTQNAFGGPLSRAGPA